MVADACFNRLTFVVGRSELLKVHFGVCCVFDVDCYDAEVVSWSGKYLAYLVDCIDEFTVAKASHFGCGFGDEVIC